VIWLLFVGAFFFGVAFVLLVVAAFLPADDPRGGLLELDRPAAREVLGRPW
jgi:hypothetical protein